MKGPVGLWTHWGSPRANPLEAGAPGQGTASPEWGPCPCLLDAGVREAPGVDSPKVPNEDRR